MDRVVTGQNNPTSPSHKGILMFGKGTNTPSIIDPPNVFPFKYFPPNAGVIASIAYVALYLLLEPVAGGVLSLLVLIGTAYGNYLTKNYSPTVNYWAGGVHIVCWLAQFVGHGVYEGRAPALLDNLFQAFFLAPLFVWLEMLFALGYRPELKRRVDKMVEVDVAKFRAGKAKNQALNGSANGHAKTS